MRTTKKLHHALADKVLAVAVVNYENEELFDWAVYIDAVPGDHHFFEVDKVASDGSKQSRELGAFLFPGFDKNKYRG